MLDPYVRPLIDPPLNFIGKQLVQRGMTANAITLLGFLMGIVAMVMIGMNHYEYALIFLLLNRFLDGIDGAVARHSDLSDFGGFLDIVCDFIIYSGIVFAFAAANPLNAFWASFLIFSFIGPITSFLTYATIAAKKQKQCSRRGKKSFYHLGGICEGTETAIVLILMCVIPDMFPELCLIYGVMCWMTTLGRIYQAWNDFGAEPLTSDDIVYKEQAIKTESQVQ
jgi:phosphatidylglycerophosphate synthase